MISKTLLLESADVSVPGIGSRTYICTMVFREPFPLPQSMIRKWRGTLHCNPESEPYVLELRDSYSNDTFLLCSDVILDAISLRPSGLEMDLCYQIKARTDHKQASQVLGYLLRDVAVHLTPKQVQIEPPPPKIDKPEEAQDPKSQEVKRLLAFLEQNAPTIIREVNVATDIEALQMMERAEKAGRARKGLMAAIIARITALKAIDAVTDEPKNPEQKPPGSPQTATKPEAKVEARPEQKPQPEAAEAESSTEDEDLDGFEEDDEEDGEYPDDPEEDAGEEKSVDAEVEGEDGDNGIEAKTPLLPNLDQGQDPAKAPKPRAEVHYDSDAEIAWAELEGAERISGRIIATDAKAKEVEILDLSYDAPLRVPMQRVNNRLMIAGGGPGDLGKLVELYIDLSEEKGRTATWNAILSVMSEAFDAGELSQTDTGAFLLTEAIVQDAVDRSPFVSNLDSSGA